jgi:hypothetical protein
MNPRFIFLVIINFFFILLLFLTIATLFMFFIYWHVMLIQLSLLKDIVVRGQIGCFQNKTNEFNPLLFDVQILCEI